MLVIVELSPARDSLMEFESEAPAASILADSPETEPKPMLLPSTMRQDARARIRWREGVGDAVRIRIRPAQLRSLQVLDVKSVMLLGCGIAMGALAALLVGVSSDPSSAEPRTRSAVGPLTSHVPSATAQPSQTTTTARDESQFPSLAPATVSSRAVFRGSLVVNSVPPAAQVFVNGGTVGTTPLVLNDLPVGSRVVRVQLAGYQSWSAAVRVVTNERTRIMADLHQLPSPLAAEHRDSLDGLSASRGAPLTAP